MFRRSKKHRSLHLRILQVYPNADYQSSGISGRHYHKRGWTGIDNCLVLLHLWVQEIRWPTLGFSLHSGLRAHIFFAGTKAFGSVQPSDAAFVKKVGADHKD